MFLLKKIIGPLLFPLPLCLLLMGVGLLLLWFTRRQRAGKSLVTAGFVLLTLLSFGQVSGPLLRTLETSYGPLEAAPAVVNGVEVKWVVVLGGGTSSDESLPAWERASEGTRARTVEGVRLLRQIPGARLVLSGGSVYGSGADADSMLALVTSLGVDGGSVRLDWESLDTE